MNKEGFENFNFDEMSPDMLKQLQIKSNEALVKKQIKDENSEFVKFVLRVEGKISDFKKTIDDLIIKSNTLEEDNIELKKKVFVLRNDQEGKYNDYKKVACARIRKLLGKSGSIEDLLFYSRFIRKLHTDVSKILGCSNTGNIMVDDVKLAQGVASKWRPDKKYLRDKYNEYYEKYENGTLKKKSEELYFAFEKYIEKTDGGKNIEF